MTDTTERALAAERQALDSLLNDFQVKQRRMLLVAVDTAIDKAITQQGDMLQVIKTKVEARHRESVVELLDELTRQQPSTVDLLITKTLDGDQNPGLFDWILDPLKKERASDCTAKLRSHLETRQGNAFCSDFQALLTVYMEFLDIPMSSGSRLGERIEDFKKALQQRAASTDELSNLVYRVNWACYGVCMIGNARSHDTTPLSDSEILELCGCFSALGAAMPTLALEFKAPTAPPPSSMDETGVSTALSSTHSSADLSTLDQLRQLAGSSGGGSDDFERILQLLAVGLNANNGNGTQATETAPASPPLPPLPPGPQGLANGSRGWAQAASPEPIPVSCTGTPESHRPPFAVQQPQVPTQTALAAVPSFRFYHERPDELPKETDRSRLAMHARMINHMRVLPKATLCPFQQGHDPSCPRSHSYLDVMTYNPLFKRLICRQYSHYYGSQVDEYKGCMCIHVDTGLTWEWLDDARNKRMYCIRGAKCTNNKCFKSHSFEELCWYNPFYKTVKCGVRAHDNVSRARGTIVPPLDCSYYHIEEGKNADMREFKIEDDYVGKNVKLLFTERTHKPLADALEALRYARAHNLNL